MNSPQQTHEVRLRGLADSGQTDRMVRVNHIVHLVPSRIHAQAFYQAVPAPGVEYVEPGAAADSGAAPGRRPVHPRRVREGGRRRPGVRRSVRPPAPARSHAHHDLRRRLRQAGEGLVLPPDREAAAGTVQVAGAVRCVHRLPIPRVPRSRVRAQPGAAPRRRHGSPHARAHRRRDRTRRRPPEPDECRLASSPRRWTPCACCGEFIRSVPGSAPNVRGFTPPPPPTRTVRTAGTPGPCGG
jgi:hypothetical protein